MFNLQPSKPARSPSIMDVVISGTVLRRRARSFSQKAHLNTEEGTRELPPFSSEVSFPAELATFKLHACQHETSR
jgi:hypothetical protein